MAIALELRAQILRLYQVELWRVGTIASQLQLHRDTVQRVLSAACVMRPDAPLRPSQIDLYLPFIRDTLAKFPTLTASRLHAMVRSRGYTGGADHFRHLVACHRPRPAAEAYLRLRTLPGEQAQVDWGHFGHIAVGRAKRPLMAFVMVLSYSRRIFLRFSLNARMDSFLRGHVLAFAAFGGVARVLLYDNLKSAVLERVDHASGTAIRFNAELLAFAAAHRYEPRPVAVARGNEKGRVERSIRYIRDNFFAARAFTDLDHLNAQAQAWCEGDACDRRWPEDDRLTVRQAGQAEQPSLMKLPEHDYPVAERVQVHAGKTPRARRGPFVALCASISTTTASLTPMFGARSPCWPTPTGCACSMGPLCWQPTGAAGTAGRRSSKRRMCRPWSITSAAPARTAPPSG